jgi:hypothetical protein
MQGEGCLAKYVLYAIIEPNRGDFNGEEESAGEAEDQRHPRPPAGKQPPTVIIDQKS